jgi:ribonucleoside-diphosphate reductase alpha subunit
MRVIKRNDETEDMMFDKISDSISVLCKEHALTSVDASVVAQKICASLFDGIKTSEIDVYASETAASMSTRHPDYGKLAALLVVRNLHKQTAEKASEVFARENAIGVMSDACYAFVQEHADAIDAAIVPDRDFLFDYFGLKTLEKGYLVRDGNKPLERPQHLWMRVAIGIWTGDLTEVLKTYDLLSQKYFTHATPTLFNAAMKHPQLSSCFLMGVKDDSIDGIYSTLKDCAHISKWAGGIGVHIHNVRSRGSPIVGTAGVSSGVMPMLRVFNATARYVNQCFTPGTRIYVRDHGAYPIGNVCPGMEVLTSDGTYRPVLEVAKKTIEDSEDILEIQVEHAFAPVHCTKEHEIYALKKQDQGFLPGFFPASQLSPGDLVGFPVPQLALEHDRIVYEEDLCFAYGAILRDGRVISDIHGRSNFSVTTSTQDTIVFFEAFLASKGITYEKPNDDTIQWSAPFDVVPIHETDVYVRETQQKFIHSRFLSLPNKQRNAIVHGLMGDSRTFTTTSEELAYGLRELLLRLGTLSSGHTQDTYLCTRYTIEISDNGGSYSTDDVLWTTIQDIKTVKHTGHVYDLNVQDNHTYVTVNMGIVHNSGKRNGSICMYMEPSHPDVFEILEARKNHGDEEARARDLFYALWIPDLFMRRVEANAKWSFFCPNKCPGLADAYGPEYDALYEKYESEKKYESQIDAQKLWAAVCNAQMETGTPFMLYKDACNMKSNQKHLGTIKSSNLCTEIVEYTSPDEIAVCNLASVCLPQFVDDGRFDFGKLHAVVKQVTWNLDRVIDVTYYPIPEAERSNKRHRPIGIGIQGLADVFMMLKMDFEGAQAKKLNRDIFETMYHAAVEASCDRAETHGPYETFKGSPASHGLLQFDLWNHKPGSARYDWQDLKYRVALSGLRNSLLLAPMPTASTSQIMGSNEAFEPYTSNIYLRRTLAGEFIVVNKHLVRDLVDLGLWNESTKNLIIKNQGSIQDIADIPDQLKPIYKTAWEMKQKSLIDMAADRGAFVCQSQSLNLFMAQPTFSKLSSMHFYAWKRGLKTGMYYLRTKPAAMPVQFTIDPKSCLTCSS